VLRENKTLSHKQIVVPVSLPTAQSDHLYQLLITPTKTQLSEAETVANYHVKSALGGKDDKEASCMGYLTL